MAMPARPTVQAGSAGAGAADQLGPHLVAGAGAGRGVQQQHPQLIQRHRPVRQAGRDLGGVQRQRLRAGAQQPERGLGGVEGPGEAEWSSMRKLQVSEADGNEAPSSHPRLTWHGPAMYLAPAAVYLACTCRVPGMYLRPPASGPARRDPPRRAARLPLPARYIRALTCTAPARYIAGTREVQGLW